MKNTPVWHALQTDEVLSILKTSPQGLSQEQVLQKRKEHGANVIPDKSARPWYVLFLKQYQSLLVWVLIAAAVISYFADKKADVYIILIVVLINTLIGFIQEWRAEQAVSSLKSMLVSKAKVVREGKTESVSAEELVPGDIIVLEEGDHIPADARLIESKNVRSIESALTGESVPVSKHSQPIDASLPMADRHNIVRKGTFLAGGYAQAVVVATGMETALGEIAQSLGSIKPGLTNFQKKTNVLAKQMAVIALFSASALFLITYFRQELPFADVLTTSIAALVSSIPEGLPAVLSIVLAIGANRMAKRKAIIREFTSTETLGAVTTIITDKTGTLTQNTLTVQKLALSCGTEFAVSGEGWSPDGKLEPISQENNIPELTESLQFFLTLCAWCNNAELTHSAENQRYELIGDPTEGALLVLAKKEGIDKQNTRNEVKKIDDFPFNSDVKMRGTLVQTQGKRILYVVGAPEKIVQQSVSYFTNNQLEALGSDKKNELRQKIEQWSGDAMRVIGLACKEMPPDQQELRPEDFTDLTFVGITGMVDPPRPDVKDAVMSCKKAGIRVIMATGDHIKTARAIAIETGIIDANDETPAYTETDLAAMSEAEFKEAVLQCSVFARLTPQSKLRIAETLQADGALVAMTGDGVNDAPALKRADVGVAMGIMGTDVARDAANVVLSDDNFSTIVSAIEEGRIVFNNTRHTSFFLLTTNFAEITTLLSAVLLGLPIPLTATQILWLNLVTDGTCTTAMATESGHGDELNMKPVDPKEKILNTSVLPFLIINAALMAIISLGVFKYYLEDPEMPHKARTATFVVMAFCQLFNVFNMRSLTQSVKQFGAFSNPYINLALAVSLVVTIAIIEIPFFEQLFSFKSLGVLDFVVLISLSSLILVAGETYKWLQRRRPQK